MKKILFLFLALSIFQFACDEIPPTITPAMGTTDPGGNTTLEEQERQVLIEEFTGVRCVNCPAGSVTIESLLATHGERLVAISLHAGFWAPPLNESTMDFQTEDGNAILNFLGQPISYPSAVVNRKKFGGSPLLGLGQGEWAGKIVEELAIPPRIKIGIEYDYDEASRELSIDLTLLPTEAISESLNLSIYVTESDIENAQDTQNGLVIDYTHRHVFRGSVTNPLGDPLSGPFVANQSSEWNGNFTLPAEWVAENCSLIAFVHYADISKEILQVAEVHVE